MEDDTPCKTCPVYVLNDTAIDQLSASELISLSPSNYCHKVYSCLSELLTTTSYKPSYIEYPQPNITLYQNGKNHPFSSCLVIWQACNIMTRRKYHKWQQEGDYIFYEYQGRSGKLIYRLPTANNGISDIDIRSVLIHLLFAACATQKSCLGKKKLLLTIGLLQIFWD